MARPNRPNRSARPAKQGRKRAGAGQEALILYGRHAVAAALANPQRTVRAVYADPADHADLAEQRPGVTLAPFGTEIAKNLPPGAVHQSIAAHVAPLEQPALEAVTARLEDGCLVMLDQVTDPQNVGAIFRSAAAFGARAVIMQAKHAPAESGALARAASGTLETVPWVTATNLSRALEHLAQEGFWCVALDGQADHAFEDAVAGQRKVCIVLGAEGPGIRPNVKEHCDAAARLSISGAVESLNVSNAAAVALYAVQRSMS